MSDDLENSPAVNLVISVEDLVQQGSLWPSTAYDQHVTDLRSNLGETIYLVEVKPSDINIAVTLGNKPSVLLDVIDFKAPDPERRLYPHMLILDDGRGLNLGWIARITRNRPFDPAPEDVLFQENKLIQQLLFHERQLSDMTVAHTSRQQLAAILGSAVQQITQEQ